MLTITVAQTKLSKALLAAISHEVIKHGTLTIAGYSLQITGIHLDNAVDGSDVITFDYQILEQFKQDEVKKHGY